jgi:acyl transferase domain-containing protein
MPSSRPIVFMFSGQGSQYFQMGRELFDRNDTFRDVMLALDRIVKEQVGYSALDVIYAPTASKALPFDQIALTHPTIFMVEYSLAMALVRAGIKPSMTLGASLGSFAAAALAGMFSAEDALKSVLQQAARLSSAGPFGGMIAVLGDPQLCNESPLREDCELAALNFPSHFVVAGSTEGLARVEQYLREKAVTFQRLPVGFAFHSRWMDRVDLPWALVPERRAPTTIPMMCCATVELLEELPDQYFRNVVRLPIRFHDAVSALERQRSWDYVDVGPSGTLATFLKYGLSPVSQSRAFPILTPHGFDLRNFTQAVEALA